MTGAISSGISSRPYGSMAPMAPMAPASLMVSLGKREIYPEQSLPEFFKLSYRGTLGERGAMGAIGAISIEREDKSSLSNNYLSAVDGPCLKTVPGPWGPSALRKAERGVG